MSYSQAAQLEPQLGCSRRSHAVQATSLRGHPRASPAAATRLLVRVCVCVGWGGPRRASFQQLHPGRGLLAGEAVAWSHPGAVDEALAPWLTRWDGVLP